MQVIVFETDRIDEMRTLARNTQQRFAGSENGPTYQMVLKDRNKPGRYYEVLEFASQEEAVRTHENPEARKFAESMAALCSRPPTLLECDIMEATHLQH